MLSEKKKSDQRQLFRTTRRNFLGLGAGLATSAGLFALLNKRHLASAATNKALASTGMDGAIVKQLEISKGMFGTTEIVGEIKRISEDMHGFYQAAQGYYGEDAKNQIRRFIPKHPLGGAISRMRTFIASEDAVDGEANPDKLSIPDPERMSEHIKKTGLFLKADAIGIGVLPKFALYTHKAPPISKVLYEGTASLDDMTPVVNDHPYVIVILVDQDLYTLKGSTGYDGISGSQSMMSYLTSGMIACCLAGYIRNLGYNARAHHCTNYQLVGTPCLISAGLGELSRIGDSVLHPVLGVRHKMAAVTTDLPLMPDKPIDFGLRDFCSKCMKCAEECPAGAISMERDQTVFNGYKKWPHDIQKCTTFRVTNRDGSSCGRCLKVCPWNNKEKSWFHDVGKWAASKFGKQGHLLKEVDDMFGFGNEAIAEYRWWLEFPELY
ncbi:MAG: reductive dehalogenase [Bacillota bacterium]